MKNQALTELHVVAHGASVLARIVEKDWTEGKKGRLPALLLTALCRLVEADPERQASEGWDSREIADKMVELGARWSSLNDADARRRVNDHWNGLMSLWELRKEELQRRLAGDGLMIEPRLEKLPGGGAGNKTSYRLQFFPVAIPPAAADSTDEGLATDQVCDASGAPEGTGKVASATRPIHYYAVPIEVPPLLSWFITHGVIKGRFMRPLVAFTVAVLGAGIWSVPMLFLIYHHGYDERAVVFLVKGLGSWIFLGLFWFQIQWFDRQAKNRVMLGPFWMRKSAIFGEAVVELRSDPVGKHSLPLHLVRYVADCPICGAEGAGRSSVRLASGGLEFYRRIVGRCRHAPQEHVWSFDHIAREGRFLR